MSVQRLFGPVLVAAVLVLLPAGPAPGTAPADGPVPVGSPYVQGKLLVAAPSMADPRFAESVVYMIEHDASGAFGLIVNKPMGRTPLAELLKSIGYEGDEAETAEGMVAVFFGGPVDTGRGFVLHSPEFQGTATRTIGPGVALSTGTDVLGAMARGEGPERVRVVLGYSGWAPGQLEGEMARDDWTTAPVDAALIFAEDPATVWRRASERSGIGL